MSETTMMPPLVATLTERFDAWVVGDAAKPQPQSDSAATPPTTYPVWQILIPERLWSAACGLAPVDARYTSNSYTAHQTYCNQEVEIRVRAVAMGRFHKLDDVTFEWMWHPATDTRFETIRATGGPPACINPSSLKLKEHKSSPVLFCEREFYCLSNFSAFEVGIWGQQFKTAEHAYQWRKFHQTSPEVALRVAEQRSAHDAKKVAHQHHFQMSVDWPAFKLAAMKDILRAKLDQHSYVQKKLLQTRGLELVEDNDDDSFWGWGKGPHHEGHNELGKLWMRLRDDLLNP